MSDQNFNTVLDASYPGIDTEEVLELVRETYTLGKFADDAMAADTTEEEVIVRLRQAGRIVAAYYVPDGAVTAHDSNNAILAVSKRPASGYGTAVVAASATTDTATGSMVAWTPYALALSGTAANTLFAAGDILTFKITKGGSGVAVKEGRLVVEVEWSFSG